MPLPWPAIHSGGAQVLSGLLGRSGQQSANAANLLIARENRAFQERMAGTQFQRATKDLELSGLNRILALGKPAPTPSGNIATMQNVEAPLQEGITKGVSSALAATRLKQEIVNMQAAEQNTRSDTSKKIAEANYVQSQDAQAQAATQNLITQNAGIATANQIAELNRQITALNIEGVKAESQFYAWLNGANASELAKTAGKAGPLALAAIRAWAAINRNRTRTTR